MEEPGGMGWQEGKKDERELVHALFIVHAVNQCSRPPSTITSAVVCELKY
jgi:hypothetical protein